MPKGFIIYLIVIGCVSALVTVSDKLRAKNGKRRVPEKTLLLLGAVGGALPMLLTMLLIRHKTRKAEFMYGLPAIILLHAAIFVIIKF